MTTTTTASHRSVCHGTHKLHKTTLLVLVFVVLMIAALVPQYYLMFHFSSSSTWHDQGYTGSHHIIKSHSPREGRSKFQERRSRLVHPIRNPSDSNNNNNNTNETLSPEMTQIPRSMLSRLFGPEPCLVYPFNSSACQVTTHYWSSRHGTLYHPTPQYNNNHRKTTTTRNGLLSTFTRSKQPTAAICLFVKNEVLYINEFIDYHLGIGFEEIFIYDNSDDFHLHHWVTQVKGPETGHRISVRHWPGSRQQVPSYQDCHAQLLRDQHHTWMAVLDVDERLVLKDATRYPTVVELLQEHCASGSLSLYWYYVGHANQTRYLPVPLMQRFRYRARHAHSLYKTIGHIATVNPQRFHVHYMKALSPATHHDVGGTVLNGQAPVPESLVSVTDRDKAAESVAAIYHYWSKSVEEFVVKACWRGRPISGKAQTRNCNKSYAETLALGSDVYDDAPWKALQHAVPEYAVLDNA